MSLAGMDLIGSFHPKVHEKLGEMEFLQLNIK